MGLLSFFQRRKGGAAGATRRAEPGDALVAERTRARRRLMGAAVLLMAGVIGFPLVFETQPRPIPVDIPIEIPRKEGAPGLAMPAARPAAAKASATPAARQEATAAAPVEARSEPALAGAAGTPPARASAVSTAEPIRKPAVAVRPAASAPAEAVRAKALLEGKEPAKVQPPVAKGEPSTKEGGRFVVQVGAFADAATAREMRSKVEKLGLKSYTQAVETASGSRIRVRAGPFDSRDEAERALAKARAAGLTAVVLTL